MENELIIDFDKSILKLEYCFVSIFEIKGNEIKLLNN
jgi:hypothetical protein